MVCWVKHKYAFRGSEGATMLWVCECGDQCRINRRTWNRVMGVRK